MNKDLKKGEILGSVLVEKARLMAKELELCTPKLTDMEYIPMIHKRFLEWTIKSGVAKTRKESELKKEFLIVIFLLYSPAVLAGKRMVDGLRVELTQLFHFKSGSAISNIRFTALSLYQYYKDFNEEVYLFYDEISTYLEAEGILVP